MEEAVMSMFNPKPCLGLTEKNTNEEIKNAAFQLVKEVGYMIIGTTSLDGRTPTARGLEVHQLDDSGDFFIGLAKGKPVYYELQKNPYIVGVIVRETVKRLSASVRISAHVRELPPEENQEIYKRYWELNPGTKALYHKDLDMFRIFVLDRGDGEIFHLPEDDEVCRLRFSFGGASKRPWAYEIDQEKCVGCGTCEEVCMEDVIFPNEEGKYFIHHFGCLECGRCAMNCPNDAIAKGFQP